VAVLVGSPHPLDRVVARPLLALERRDLDQRDVDRGAAAEQLLASSVPSSRTSRRRISAGSVNPCTTSVVRITANVISRTTSRWGNSGASASAAASDTDPRIPDQPTIRRVRQPARRSRCCGRRSSARMTKTEVFSQAIRVSVTVTLIATACPISASADWPARPSRIKGSCRPMSTNSSALSRNTSVSQTAKPCRRMLALEIRGAFGRRGPACAASIATDATVARRQTVETLARAR
jgi:hypothetical protein